MADLSHKQEQALEHPIRKQIFELLQTKPNPASIGYMLDVIEDLRDYAKASYQVGVLVDAELVEKVWGTNLFRVVER